MDDTVQKSCWGLTARATAGVLAIIVIAWLLSNGEASAATLLAR